MKINSFINQTKLKWNRHSWLHWNITLHVDWAKKLMRTHTRARSTTRFLVFCPLVVWLFLLINTPGTVHFTKVNPTEVDSRAWLYFIFSISSVTFFPCLDFIQKCEKINTIEWNRASSFDSMHTHTYSGTNGEQIYKNRNYFSSLKSTRLH